MSIICKTSTNLFTFAKMEKKTCRFEKLQRLITLCIIILMDAYSFIPKSSYSKISIAISKSTVPLILRKNEDPFEYIPITYYIDKSGSGVINDILRHYDEI